MLNKCDNNYFGLQPHLPSIFDAIYTVEFDDKDRIYEMNSDNGETIPMERPVACIGGVEVRENQTYFIRVEDK